jgi:hypothetical protein
MKFRQWLNNLEHNQLNVGNTFDQGPVGDYKDGNNGMGIRSKWQQTDEEPEEEDKEIGQQAGTAEKIFGFKHRGKDGRNHDELLRLGALDQKKKFMTKKMNR